MRHALSIVVGAGLFLATAVDVIAAGAKISSHRNHYGTAVGGIAVALPSGMKLPPELLLQ